MWGNRGRDSLLPIVHCCFEVWYVGVLRAITLIGCCILLEKILKKKIDGLICLKVAFLLVVFSLGMKL